MAQVCCTDVDTAATRQRIQTHRPTDAKHDPLRPRSCRECSAQQSCPRQSAPRRGRSLWSLGGVSPCHSHRRYLLTGSLWRCTPADQRSEPPTERCPSGTTATPPARRRQDSCDRQDSSGHDGRLRHQSRTNGAPAQWRQRLLRPSALAVAAARAALGPADVPSPRQMPILPAARWYARRYVRFARRLYVTGVLVLIALELVGTTWARSQCERLSISAHLPVIVCHSGLALARTALIGSWPSPAVLVRTLSRLALR